MSRFFFLGTSLLSISATLAHPLSAKRENETDGPEPGSGFIQDFANITACEELKWVPCFGEGFECTHLTVPLDYADPSVGTTDVAFIKYSTSNGIEGQDILFNPGGPNASGVKSLIQNVEQFEKWFGPGYTFISFDPRGVNNTGPALSCFNSTEERDAFTEAPTSPLPELWANTKAYGQYCTNINQRKETKYAGTPAIVQDMMHMVELRAKAAGRDPQQEKIWYYGISYGTIVGQTLSAMYPDRLGRVILDGNVNGEEHYRGYVPSDVDDTDKAFEFFTRICFEAGEKCEFSGNSTSADEVATRLRNLVNKLEREPVPYGPSSPKVLTRSEFLATAVQSLYGPSSGYSTVAKMAAALERDNLSALTTKLGATDTPESSLLQHNPKYDEKAEGEALQLITAIDCSGRYPLKSLADYEAAMQDLERRSVYGAQNTGTKNVPLCNGMQIIPPESQFFPGFNSSSRIDTSVPVLFVGTTADPITPMSSAHHMSAYFPGSVVLEQYSGGHGFMGIKSECTRGHVRAYLKDATLPTVGTVCQVDVTATEFFPQAEASK